MEYLIPVLSEITTGISKLLRYQNLFFEFAKVILGD